MIEISKELKKIQFFSSKSYFGKSEYIDLAINLNFLEIKNGKNVIKFGELGDLFYIILKGSVAVEIPNPNMKNW